MNEPEKLQGDEPDSVPVDPGGAQRKLEAAGWKPVRRQGKLLWRHPESGHLYPQGPALRRLEMNSAGEEATDEEPEAG